jgi:hypothetical protein
VSRDAILPNTSTKGEGPPRRSLRQHRRRPNLSHRQLPINPILPATPPLERATGTTCVATQDGDAGALAPFWRAKWPDRPATRRSRQRPVKPRVAVRVADVLGNSWDVARLAYGGWRPSSMASLKLVWNPWCKRCPVWW